MACGMGLFFCGFPSIFVPIVHGSCQVALNGVAAYKERSPTVGVELGDAVRRPGSPKIMAGDN